jgi:hypothetical protein
MAQLDPGYAEQLYSNYTRTFWLERGILAGFAEWPHGQDRYQDADSGPIFNGIGTAATGLGIGTAIAMRDGPRLERLTAQLAMRDVLMLALEKTSEPGKTGAPTLLGGMIPIDPQYFTGFLFGDAILFYSVSWRSWTQ